MVKWMREGQVGQERRGSGEEERWTEDRRGTAKMVYVSRLTTLVVETTKVKHS